jgi:catechol 2,3-dioxygenase-like lactoylglutathione lyase family enzyme
MFDHVGVRVSNREASEAFYDLVLPVLGISKTHRDRELAEWDDFALSPATEEKRVTRRLHVGFVAPSRDVADEFWRVGVDAGYRSDGERSTTPGTTARTCSTRTGTTSRW